MQNFQKEFLISQTSFVLVQIIIAFYLSTTAKLVTNPVFVYMLLVTAEIKLYFDS